MKCFSRLVAFIALVTVFNIWVGSSSVFAAEDLYNLNSIGTVKAHVNGNKVITITGAGQIERIKWWDMVNAIGESDYKFYSWYGMDSSDYKIVFDINAGERVLLPQNSSYFFAYFKGDIDFKSSVLDTSKVSNMTFMFEEALKFNENIGYWNMENVTNVSGMFFNASAFNNGSPAGVEGYGLNEWNLKNVKDSSSMFAYAISFNQNIDNWKLPRVKETFGMFKGTAKFAQNVDEDKFPILDETEKINEDSVPEGIIDDKTYKEIEAEEGAKKSPQTTVGIEPKKERPTTVTEVKEKTTTVAETKKQQTTTVVETEVEQTLTESKEERTTTQGKIEVTSKEVVVETSKEVSEEVTKKPTETTQVVQTTTKHIEQDIKDEPKPQANGKSDNKKSTAKPKKMLPKTGGLPIGAYGALGSLFIGVGLLLAKDKK